ncbi:hypothetical protein WK57_17805 [Burkholderia ubonensis]|uniref:Uncharacterized protein n=2 Tax=Burkholderia ubonensis TaxID=101571 RepID=A0AA40R9H9_9BURK|nr:hypothetical protein WL16_26235 [Burkholderia ubonensis]KWZ58361.1 hypothetical protein WK57_17805 [Burkholderia ubonensis]
MTKIQRKITMNIEQEKFEQIVKDVMSALEAKHAHVQTITGGAEPARFTLGFATTADALLIALSAAGITVGSGFNDNGGNALVEAYARKHGQHFPAHVVTGTQDIAALHAHYSGDQR